MQSDEVMDLIQENEAAQVEADFSAGTTSEFNFEAFDDPNARNMLGKQVTVAASFFDKGYADQMLKEGRAYEDHIISRFVVKWISSYRRLHVTLLLKPLILKGDKLRPRSIYRWYPDTGSYVAIATAEGRRPI